MDLKNKIAQFNRRWNVSNDIPYEDEFRKFKIRILNILENIDRQVTEESVSIFCRLYGIPEEWQYSYMGDKKWSKNIINHLKSENNEVEFYKILEVIFSLHIPGLMGYGREVYSKKSIYDEVCQAIEFSNINLATTMIKKGEIIFYPKGEELLDEDLVNMILSFLSGSSHQHFVDALKFYQANNFIKSAESIRRCIEEFLRIVLNNKDGLKNNVKLVQKKLKSDKKHANIRNIIGNIFNYLDHYFNDESKHNDGELGDEENEFLIYQSALLMRYINKTI